MSDVTAARLAAREVALAQARTLARHGRFAEAEELLDGAWGTTDPGPAVLDLRARIHAQQGRLDQADRCWAEAERLAPGDKQIADGRARIAALRDGRTRRLGSGALAGGSIVVVLAVAVLAGVWIEDDEPAPTAAPTAAPVARPSGGAPAATPSGGVPVARPSDTGDAVLAGLDLKVPGVRVRRGQAEIAITFEHGLFPSGTSLSPQGRAVLRDLAARLRPYRDRVDVTIVGHTDGRAVRPGGEYASNIELGAVRAAVVLDVLHDAGRIPVARLSVATTGSDLPPFRGGAAERNRTVSLRVTAVGGR